MKRRMLWRISGVVLTGLICLGVWNYNRAIQGRSCTRELFAMDTVMNFTAYGRNCEEAVEAAVQEVQRLDKLLSTGNTSSEISGLNRSGSGEISEDTAELFRRGMDIYEKTDGLFDFTIYPLMELWGFPSKEYHVPTKGELKEALPLVDASKVSFTENEVHLGEGQQVDFGGIAKGYTSGRVMEIYREYGVSSGMVSLGGNVQVYRRRPDGSLWRIGIRDPEGGPEDMAAMVEVEDCAVVTSGGYERYFEEDGNTYIHILDPKTGYPAEGDLASVTVISGDGTLADALSTSLYIMGMEDAVSCWRTYRDDFEMILITEEGTIYATEGVSGQLQSRRGIQVIKG